MNVHELIFLIRLSCVMDQEPLVLRPPITGSSFGRDRSKVLKSKEFVYPSNVLVWSSGAEQPSHSKRTADKKAYGVVRVVGARVEAVLDNPSLEHQTFKWRSSNRFKRYLDGFH